MGALKGNTSFESQEQSTKESRSEKGKMWRMDLFWNPEQQSQDLGKDETEKTKEDKTQLGRMTRSPHVFYRM